MSIRVTVNRLGPTLEDQLDLKARKMLLDLHGGLVRATPVDTGRARAGWTVDTSAGEIQNNVEYIGKLNQGHSQQAPTGFIETEIDRAARLNS